MSMAKGLEDSRESARYEAHVISSVKTRIWHAGRGRSSAPLHHLPNQQTNSVPRPATCLIRPKGLTLFMDLGIFVFYLTLCLNCAR